MSYNLKKEKQNAIPLRKEFRTFEDLDAYQEAREFRKKMYAVTRRLPDFEKYDLGSQIRRAAVSLTNQVRFFLGSRGSLQELVDDLNVCADENYLEPEKIEALKGEAWRVLGLINGYLRYLRDRQADGGSVVREGRVNSPEDDEAWVWLTEALSAAGPI